MSWNDLMGWLGDNITKKNDWIGKKGLKSSLKQILKGLRLKKGKELTLRIVLQFEWLEYLGYVLAKKFETNMDPDNSGPG